MFDDFLKKISENLYLKKSRFEIPSFVVGIYEGTLSSFNLQILCPNATAQFFFLRDLTFVRSFKKKLFKELRYKKVHKT